jgi:hypothetical protein
LIYRPKYISYLKVGRLLHIITIAELVAIIVLIPHVPDFISESNLGLLFLKSYALVYMIWLPVSAQLDARSRFQNYKQIKDQLYLNGFQQRILKPVLKSRCQRDAAAVAAMELGYHEQCKQYFSSNGFRWYHLLPAWVFAKPQYLFTVYFFKTTFFASFYHPKVDFKVLLKTKSDILPINNCAYEKAG